MTKVFYTYFNFLILGDTIPTKKKKNVTEKKITKTTNATSKKAVTIKTKGKVSATKSKKSFFEDKRKITIIAAVALVVVIVAIAGFYYMQESDKNKVEEAVKLHMDYYNTRNIDAYYDLVSQSSKDKYGIKLEDISNLLNKAAFDGTNITLVNLSQITIQGDAAEAKGVIIAKNNKGSETKSFVELYKKENGVWKYEQRMWEDTATSQVPQQ